MRNSLLQTASKRAIQKTAETIGNIIRNEIIDKITRVSITSPKNNSQTNEVSQSVGRSVGRSVGLSVRRSVGRSVGQTVSQYNHHALQIS